MYSFIKKNLQDISIYTNFHQNQCSVLMYWNDFGIKVVSYDLGCPLIHTSFYEKILSS